MSQNECKSIYYKGHNGRGLLLIHGFTGTPLDMVPLAEFFRGIGFAISVPLLAGHGTSPEHLKKTTWKDWLRSAEEGYHQLRLSGSESVYMIGHSMGGLLGMKLALDHPFKALATLSSPIFVHDKRIKYVRYLKWILPYIRRTEKKAPHIEQYLKPYHKTPLASLQQLHELMKSTTLDLPRVETPIFIAQSGADETVHPSSADYIYKHIGSHYKKVRHYPNSTHIITRDHDCSQLNRDIATYFEYIRKELEGG